MFKLFLLILRAAYISTLFIHIETLDLTLNSFLQEGQSGNNFCSLIDLGCNRKTIKLFDPPINGFTQKVVDFQKFFLFYTE